jgi:hypothetical protein
MALRFPIGFLALRDVAQRVHHPSITTDSAYDGERWIRYHDYYRELIGRRLPDVTLPRQSKQLHSEAYIWAALDAIEQGDRRKSARYLASGVRVYAPALAIPRVAAAAVALVTGDRGARLMRRVRDRLRRRNEILVYEPADLRRP